MTYEIVVGDKPEATKKGTKVFTKEVTIKNVKDAQHVWIRVAGDKKSGVWTGEYAELGVVDFPYTIPKKQAQQQ